MTTAVGLGRIQLAFLFAAVLNSCVRAPRARAAPGVVSTAPVPVAGLGTRPRLIVLQWELQDPDFVARGEAAARIVPPDSARLDFFLAAGLGRGAVVLVGDTLRFPSSANDAGRRLVPSPPLLWATLGRLAVPAFADTSVYVQGDTLRADIGRPLAWRVTFLRDSLWRLERVSGGRVIETVQRIGPAAVRYRHEANRRQLDLNVTRAEFVSAFDPWIWHLP